MGGGNAKPKLHGTTPAVDYNIPTTCLHVSPVKALFLFTKKLQVFRKKLYNKFSHTVDAEASKEYLVIFLQNEKKTFPVQFLQVEPQYERFY